MSESLHTIIAQETRTGRPTSPWKGLYVRDVTTGKDRSLLAVPSNWFAIVEDYKGYLALRESADGVVPIACPMVQAMIKALQSESGDDSQKQYEMWVMNRPSEDLGKGLCTLAGDACASCGLNYCPTLWFGLADKYSVSDAF